tara:strand:- start:566 stop:742 length:177 start_codon:yes stop_codon:yes gene_type:complete
MLYSRGKLVKKYIKIKVMGRVEKINQINNEIQKKLDDSIGIQKEWLLDDILNFIKNWK